MTEIRNMTPHEITYFFDEGTSVTFPPQKESIRIDEKQTPQKNIGVYKCVSNEVIGHNLPPQQEGVTLLVSRLVLDAFPQRKDLVAPDTGKTAKRNEKGQVIGIYQFTVKK